LSNLSTIFGSGPRTKTPGYQILQLFDQSCTLTSGNKALDFYNRLKVNGLSEKARLVTHGEMKESETGRMIPLSFVEYCPSKYGFVMDPTYARIKLFRAPYENAARKETNKEITYIAKRFDKNWEDVLKNRLATPKGDQVLRIIERLVEYPYA
jgi:hypothetical protein